MEANGTRVVEHKLTGGITTSRKLVRESIAGRAHLLAVVVTGLLVAALSLYNLGYYPRIGHDEGINLQAAKILAQTGHYGFQYAYSDPLSAGDVAMSTGPTVIVPVALLFKILGVGIVQGRLVMAMYILLAALGAYWVGRQLFGPAVGIISVLVFIAVTSAGPFANGRDVLGEVPAVAWLLLGTGALIHAQSVASSLRYAVAGVLLGLAILTKVQFVLLLPVLPALWLVSRRQSGEFSFKRLCILLVALVTPIALWYLRRPLTGDTGGLASQLQQMYGVGSTLFFGAPFRRIHVSVAYLVTSGFAVWGAVGLAYVAFLSFREGWYKRPERMLLLGFVLVWLGWFVIVSVGWTRYAVPAVLASSPLVAKTLYDLAMAFGPLGPSVRGRFLRSLADNPAGTALLAIIVAAILSGILTNLTDIARARDAAPQYLAAAINRDLAPDAIVESSEYEIDFLTNRYYQRPHLGLVNDYISAYSLGEHNATLPAYRVPADTTYLINGPFSKAAGLYNTELAHGEFTLFASYADYDLYRRATK